jgi:tRNA G10  N-methylase Trm11
MLDDILDFAALSLVDNGRLSFWMPTANDQDQEINIPEHPGLQITSVCTQAFNRCKFKTPVPQARLTSDRVQEAYNLQKDPRR